MLNCESRCFFINTEQLSPLEEIAVTEVAYITKQQNYTRNESV
jgi:hypothetical protein